ncbi:uncharacterized protein LOC114327063 [Diabrotica virgifera virgifera]|uniref:Uncharacterized protein LOC114327063 n=1 Tax=Diabrotica virgifera virgifera TaxID=50390 RepID=A0A6P7F798_DIAVI|nr:uncharacterized protein LOC114327063 [Diabrotica virgifera virgifera]
MVQYADMIPTKKSKKRKKSKKTSKATCLCSKCKQMKEIETAETQPPKPTTCAHCQQATIIKNGECSESDPQRFNRSCYQDYGEEEEPWYMGAILNTPKRQPNFNKIFPKKLLKTNGANYETYKKCMYDFLNPTDRASNGDECCSCDETSNSYKKRKSSTRNGSKSTSCKQCLNKAKMNDAIKKCIGHSLIESVIPALKNPANRSNKPTNREQNGKYKQVNCSQSAKTPRSQPTEARPDSKVRPSSKFIKCVNFEEMEYKKCDCSKFIDTRQC